MNVGKFNCDSVSTSKKGIIRAHAQHYHKLKTNHSERFTTGQNNPQCMLFISKSEFLPKSPRKIGIQTRIDLVIGLRILCNTPALVLKVEQGEVKARIQGFLEDPSLESRSVSSQHPPPLSFQVPATMAFLIKLKLLHMLYSTT